MNIFHIFKEPLIGEASIRKTKKKLIKMKTQINLQLHQKQKKYLIHKSKSCFLEMTNEIEKNGNSS